MSSNEHWSEYWRTGVMTSLPSDFKANYDQEIKEYWRTIVKDLPQGASILDLCTGNGAVALLLHELAQELELSVSITAVDAAIIDSQALLNQHPDQKEAIQAIQFILECRIEDMSDRLEQKFDLVVSQYGIEYCDESLAAPAVVSCLKPNGRFVFIAHAEDTAMLKQMDVEQQAYDSLVKWQVFDHFKDFSRSKISVNGFKNKLKQVLNAISVHPMREHVLLTQWAQAIYQLLQMSNAQLKQQKQQVGQFQQGHRNAYLRAKDMLWVSDKMKQNPKWYEAFVAAGLKLHKTGEIQYMGQHHAGRCYEFKF